MTMMRVICVGAVLAMVPLTAMAQSQPNRLDGPRVVRLLEGYTCMALNLRDDQNSFNDLPPIRADPTARSPEIGIASGTVIVAEPRREQNGFIAVLHMDGRAGWLEARMVRPWVNRSNPTTQCHPAMMSNGRPGFTYTRPHG